MPTVSSRIGPQRAADVTSGRAGIAGQARLLDDWKQATVDDAVVGLARQQLRPQYQQALSQATAQAGRPLTNDELGEVVGDVDRQLLKGAEAKVRAAVAGDSTAPARLVAQAVATLKQQAPTLRNPFTAVAMGEPRARARETVLFENAQLLVLVDKFCPSPKVLVIPKARALTPLDVPPALLTELSRVAAAASETFQKVAQSKPAEVWVNSPQTVTIGQLHVHVQPKLPDFSAQLTRAEAADAGLARRRLATLQGEFWKKFGTQLQARLRP